LRCTRHLPDIAEVPGERAGRRGDLRQSLVHFMDGLQPLDLVALPVKTAVRTAIDEHETRETLVSRYAIEIPGRISECRPRTRGMPAQENPPPAGTGSQYHAAQFAHFHRKSPIPGLGRSLACDRAIASPQVVVLLSIVTEPARVDEILLPPLEGPHLGVSYRLAEIPADIAEEPCALRVTRHENEHPPRAARAHFQRVNAVSVSAIRRAGRAERHIPVRSCGGARDMADGQQADEHSGE